MPAATPEAAKPLAAVTLKPSTPASRSPAVSGRPSARFAFCTAWPAAPLPRLSIAQTTIRVPVARSVKTPSSAASVPCTRDELGRDSLRAAASPPAMSRRRPRAARARPSPDLHVARRDQARGGRAAGAGRSRPESRAPARSRARAGASRPCTAETFSSTTPRGIGLQRPAGARDPGLRVDDDAARLDHTCERREREQRGGRVAAGVRDQRPGRREELGNGVAPAPRARRRAGARSRTTPRRATASQAGARRRDRRRRRRGAARAPPLARGRGSRRRAPRRSRGPRRSGRTPARCRCRAAGRARSRAARRASPSRAQPARARGARARGRGSPGRSTRTRRGSPS